MARVSPFPDTQSFWRIWPAGNEWAYRKSGAGLLVIPDARINEGYGHKEDLTCTVPDSAG